MSGNIFPVRLKIIGLLLVVLMLVGALPFGAAAAEIESPGAMPGAGEQVSVIIQGDDVAVLAELVASYGGRITRELAIIHSVEAEIPAAAMAALERHPAVRRVWLNQTVSHADVQYVGGTLLWQAGTEARVNTTPAGNGDLLVLADRENRLYAFGADGSQLWSFATADNLRSGPTLGPDGRVLIGDLDGTVYALSASGDLEWTFATGTTIKQQVAVDSNGQAYIAAQRILYQVDTDGNEIDSYRSRGRITTGPVLSADEQLVYWGDNRGTLYAYRPGVGLEWQSDVAATAVGDGLLVSPDGRLVTWARDTVAVLDSAGAVQWTFTAAAKLGGQPAVDAAGNLYLGDHRGTLSALDAAGNTIYSVATRKPIKQGLAVSDRGTLFAAAGNWLLAVDPAGETLFQFKAPGRITAAPILSADEMVVYLADSSEEVLAVSTGIEPPVADTNYPQVAGAENVWAAGVTGQGVAVAVVDTGIEPLAGLAVNSQGESRLVGWADMIAGSPSPIDPNGHGTHVAGIIANSARTESNSFAGVAPDVNLVGVRVMDENGSGTYADVIAGIGWVVENKETLNIRVMNLSLVGAPQSHYWDDPLNQAVMAAWAADIVVVAAAGNGGPAPMSIGVPGNVPYIVTVGAFTDNFTPTDFSDDYLAPFSAAGPTWDGFVKPDLIAPGAHMASLLPADSTLALTYADRQVEGDYYQLAGTSTAAPVVSAISAMILEANPALSADQVKYRLLAGARLAVQDSDGDGVMDALAVSPWQQGTGHVWAADAVFATTMEAANSGMDLAQDLAGEAHYIGPTLYHEETDSYYVAADGEYVWNGSEYVWNGGEYVWNGGEYVWNGSEYVWNGSEYVWNGSEYVWNGGEYVWNGGEYVWNGSEYVWNGGEYVWNGSEYVWNGSEYVWNGSEYVWNGSEYVWNGGEYVWNGSEYVWNGGEYVWNGGEYVWNGSEYVWNGGEYVWNGGEYVWNGGEYVWNGGLEQAILHLGLSLTR